MAQHQAPGIDLGDIDLTIHEVWDVTADTRHVTLHTHTGMGGHLAVHLPVELLERLCDAAAEASYQEAMVSAGLEP